MLTRIEIRSAVATLRYYRNFIRSDYELAKKPFDPWEGTMNKAEAQKILWDLINRKINTRSGYVKPFRKECDHYRMELLRDKWALEDLAQGIRHTRFNTAAIRKRFSHLLSRED